MTPSPAYDGAKRGEAPSHSHPTSPLDQPAVSIIIPFYNAHAFLKRALESIDYSPVEVIVVDDGSSEPISSGTLSGTPFRTHLLTQLNRGAAAARNVGLAAASSEYVVFLDADDYFESGYLEQQIDCVLSNGSDFTVGPFTVHTIRGDSIARSPQGDPSDIDEFLSGTLSHRWFPVHSILWDRKFLSSIGGWNEGMRLNDDGEFLTRALLLRPNISFSRGACAVYQQHSSVSRVSSSSDKRDLEAVAEFLERTAVALRLGGFSKARAGLAHQAAEMANFCFELGYTDVGHRCSALWRLHGTRRELPGSVLHRLTVLMLGFRAKAFLSKLRQKA